MENRNVAGALMTNEEERERMSNEQQEKENINQRCHSFFLSLARSLAP